MNTRELIEAAFADVPYPSADIIAPQRCPQCAAELRDYLEGKSWHELSFPDLPHESLSLLTPEGLLYFLPGYLVATLNLSDWKNAGMVPYSIMRIGGYEDDPKNVKDEARENRKIFSSSQREAIASWLVDLTQLGPVEWRDDHEDVQYAIDRILND